MNKPWLDNYPANVPAEINPDIYPSVPAMIGQAVEKFGDLPALTCFGKDMSYREWDAAADALAAALQAEYGIKKGDRVALMCPNVFAFPVAMLAILKVGAVQVNVNPLYTPRELEHQLQDAGAELILLYTGSTASLAAVRDKAPVKDVVTIALGDGAGLDIPSPEIDPNLGPSTPIADLLTKYQGQKPQDVKIEGQNPLFLQYTGGTTGPSKGATLTHRNLIANCEQFRAHAPEVNNAGEEVVILCLPLYHIFGLMILNAYASIGSRMILIPNPRDMDAFLGAIKDAKFSVIAAVNTLYAGMTQHPLFKEVDFSNCKFSVGGGAKIFKSTSDAWHARAGRHIVEGYGLSETSPILTLNFTSGENFTGTIGYPIPSTDVVVLDDAGKPVKIGDAGEICARGPQIMDGYWNNPAATKAVFTEDGYFRTGDVAIMHEDGQFEIVDRKKDMIIVSGFNVYPNEVEGVAVERPDVAEACCVGVADAKTGEAVRLFVTAVGGGEVDVDALVAHCRTQLAGYKVPKEIKILSEIPKSSVGKILRRELRDG